MKRSSWQWPLRLKSFSEWVGDKIPVVGKAGEKPVLFWAHNQTWVAWRGRLGGEFYSGKLRVCVEVIFVYRAGFDFWGTWEEDSGVKTNNTSINVSPPEFKFLPNRGIMRRVGPKYSVRRQGDTCGNRARIAAQFRVQVSSSSSPASFSNLLFLPFFPLLL